MKDIIDTIGRVITSPYPYFALLGFFGWKGYETILGQGQIITGYTIISLLTLYGFLGSLSWTVYLLIRKVGHASMLPPEIQLQLEQLRLDSSKRKENIDLLRASAGQEVIENEQ